MWIIFHTQSNSFPDTYDLYYIVIYADQEIHTTDAMPDLNQVLVLVFAVPKLF